MSKSIPFKNNSIHLFMPGNFSGINSEFGGVACGFGCNEWSMAIGVYYKFVNSDPSNRNHWEPATNWCHELGHNLNLYHTFGGDSCADTPPLCKRCTNNMMDYGKEESLTQCQLSKMYNWLETHSAIVKSGLPNYNMSGQITWSGGSASLDPVLNNVPDPAISVDIEAPGANDFIWKFVDGSGTWSTNADGTLTNINIDYDDHMEFDVETEANCQDLNETYVFIHQPYNLYPNPAQDYLTIKQNPKLIDVSSKYSTKTKNFHGLKIFDQDKELIYKSQLKPNFETHLLDISTFSPGFYFIELSNTFFSETYKIQKL